jgi:hypothetical protein
MEKELKQMTPEERQIFRSGFVAGWQECAGSVEQDKTKLKQIAVAAADNYLNARK